MRDESLKAVLRGSESLRSYPKVTPSLLSGALAKFAEWPESLENTGELDGSPYGIRTRVTGVRETHRSYRAAHLARLGLLESLLSTHRDLEHLAGVPDHVLSAFSSTHLETSQ